MDSTLYMYDRKLNHSLQGSLSQPILRQTSQSMREERYKTLKTSFTFRLSWSFVPMRQVQRYPIWINDVTVTFKPRLSFDWHGQRIPCIGKLRTSGVHISQVISKKHAFAREILGQLRSGACVFCAFHDKIKKSHT